MVLMPRLWEAKAALVKQIRNGDIVEKLMDRGDGYFRWLQTKSNLSGPLSSLLADTEFISLYKLDDVLVEKAKEETRQKYAEDVCENSEEVETIVKSIRGNCCLFEVIFCLAVALNEMFEDLDAADGVQHFFGIMLKNCGLDKYDEEDLDMYPDKVRKYWKKCIDRIIKREYTDTGNGGLFPLSNLELWEDNTVEFVDRRSVSLWQQMNDWVDLHTNEDGEWVD